MRDLRCENIYTLLFFKNNNDSLRLSNKIVENN